MLMKRIDSADALRAEFKAYDRDYFSYDGYAAILELFEGETAELDAIAICCDFSEYTAEELINEYGDRREPEDEDDEKDEEEIADEIADALENETYISRLRNGNYLIQNF